MKTIYIQKRAGGFAENKDIARDIREKVILPRLKKGQEIVLDFSDVTGVTQSFMHALISEAIRQYGDDVYDKVLFKNCNEVVQSIVNIVADYMEEA